MYLDKNDARIVLEHRFDLMAKNNEASRSILFTYEGTMFQINLPLCLLRCVGSKSPLEKSFNNRYFYPKTFRYTGKSIVTYFDWNNVFLRATQINPYENYRSYILLAKYDTFFKAIFGIAKCLTKL